MSRKNDKFQGGTFPKPPMPFAPWGTPGKKNSAGDGENNTQKEKIKSTIKSAWTQRNDRKKSALDNRKEQWKQLFDYRMKMQNTFAASLPDDTSSLPPFAQSLPISPKAFMERLMEFEIMANEHFVEQADSFMDFLSRGREQVFDMVSEAMDRKEEDEPAKADGAEEKADAVKKAGTKTAKTTGTKTAKTAGTKTAKTAGTKTAKAAGTKTAKAAAAKPRKTAAAKAVEEAEAKAEEKVEKKPAARAAQKTGTKAGKKAETKAGKKAETRSEKKAKAEDQDVKTAEVVETVEDIAVKEAGTAESET